MLILLMNLAFSFQTTNHLDLGLSYQRFEYEEPGLMTEEGQLPGLELQYEYFLAANTSLKFKGAYYKGELRYDGSTFGGTPVETDTEDKIYYIGARFQYYPASSTSRVFVGLELRNWFNDLVISYTRETEYLYLPIGFDYQLGPNWQWGIQYNYWIEGNNTSTMSDTSSSRQDVDFTQDTGNGFKFHIRYLFATSPFYLDFFYESWDVEDSDIQFDGVDTLVEPKNNSSIYGLTLYYSI